MRGIKTDKTLGTVCDDIVLSSDLENNQLFSDFNGVNEHGEIVAIHTVNECMLTVYLNDKQMVTLMTIGDHPQFLALGFLLNQKLLLQTDQIAAIRHDSRRNKVHVYTTKTAPYMEGSGSVTRTSGCGVGTIYNSVMDYFHTITFPLTTTIPIAWLHSLHRKINQHPSLYLKAGAIHGCVLCQEDRPLVYMEDIGRHNAVDKIAGYMYTKGISPEGMIFYTTGRLTSEMVIKTALMGIPILVSRSGFTAWGVQLARKINLTMVGRMSGSRCITLAGAERICFDNKQTAGD